MGEEIVPVLDQLQPMMKQFIPAKILSYIHNGGPYSNEMPSYVGAKEYFAPQQYFFYRFYGPMSAASSGRRGSEICR